MSLSDGSLLKGPRQRPHIRAPQAARVGGDDVCAYYQITNGRDESKGPDAPLGIPPRAGPYEVEICPINAAPAIGRDA